MPRGSGARCQPRGSIRSSPSLRDPAAPRLRAATGRACTPAGGAVHGYSGGHREGASSLASRTVAQGGAHGEVVGIGGPRAGDARTGRGRGVPFSDRGEARHGRARGAPRPSRRGGGMLRPGGTGRRTFPAASPFTCRRARSRTTKDGWSSGTGSPRPPGRSASPPPSSTRDLPGGWRAIDRTRVARAARVAHCQLRRLGPGAPRRGGVAGAG